LIDKASVSKFPPLPEYYFDYLSKN
jgi:hypothetical protein